MRRDSIEQRTSPNILLLAIAYLGFISLGLPDTVLGVAWPSVRDTFGLHQSDIAFIFVGTGISYFLSSFFTGKLLSIWGIGFLLAASSAIVALCQFGYGLAPVWPLFVTCSLLHGIGSGAIDAGLNHYVAHHFSARHMNWLHACYSLGATLGPLIMTGVLTWYASWRAGYLTVATVLFFLGILFLVTRRKWDAPGEMHTEQTTGTSVSMSDTLKHPLVWLQVAIFFVYTGLEVTVGQWSFTVLRESRLVPAEVAGLWVTIYWASIFVGRVLFGFIVEHVGIDRLLRLSISLVVIGGLLFALRLSGTISVLGLALIGVGLAPIYPCLMTRTPQRLGSGLAAHAIGFQVSAAMLGAAALPSLSGFLAQGFGLESVAVAAVVMAFVLGLMHESLLRISKLPEGPETNLR